MKISRIGSKEDRSGAFEVENLNLGRRGFCRVIEKIPSARIVRRPKFLSWFWEDVFCEFEIDGVRFEAEEPYGDSDHYWVGPSGTGVDGKELEYHPQIEIVIAAFEAEK